jgi:hypothetical protein
MPFRFQSIGPRQGEFRSSRPEVSRLAEQNFAVEEQEI